MGPWCLRMGHPSEMRENWEGSGELALGIRRISHMENMAIYEPKVWSDEGLGWCYGDEGNGQRRAG